MMPTSVRMVPNEVSQTCLIFKDTSGKKLKKITYCFTALPLHIVFILHDAHADFLLMLPL
jgi:hypothetical protein